MLLDEVSSRSIVVSWLDLVRIALFAGLDWDCQAVDVWRQGAGCVGGVGARWILETVEVQDEGAGLVDSVVGQAGVEES